MLQGVVSYSSIESQTITHLGNCTRLLKITSIVIFFVGGNPISHLRRDIEHYTSPTTISTFIYF